MRFAAILLSSIISCASYGAVSITGNVDSGTGVLTISSDLTWTVTSTGTAHSIVFRGWGLPLDGQNDLSALSPGTLDYSLNGGTDQQAVGDMRIFDSYLVNYHDLVAGDAYIYFDTGVALTTGDTITFRSDTWSMATPIIGNGWNPATTGTFSGEIYIMDDDANYLSGAIIPEPNAYAACIALFAGMLLYLRRHRG